jgi:hypothetical protein
VLWVKWLVAVSVNVVVWILVSSTSGHLAYPWPLWVATAGTCRPPRNRSCSPSYRARSPAHSGNNLFRVAIPKAAAMLLRAGASR